MGMELNDAQWQALTDQVGELAAQVGELARRHQVSDAVIEAERARAVAEDRASRPASRRPASRRGRGHLRPVGDGAS